MNFSGRLLYVYTDKDQTENTIDVNSQEHLDYLSIASKTKLQMAFAGQFLCYKSQDCEDIKIVDTRKIVSSSKSISPRALNLKTEFNVIIEDFKLSLIACSPIHMSKISTFNSLDLANFEKLSNYLQVTFDKTSYILNLNKECTVLVKQIDNTDELKDPQKYVNPGINVTVF